MKYAVVDLGANTIRMSVYENSGESLRHIMSEKEVIGLLNYTENGLLTEDGILKIQSTLSDYLRTSQDIGADSFNCFATAGLRSIRNSREVLQRIKTETGIQIHLISGEEEARLDFTGAYLSSGLSSGLMVDMGGGSTELVLFNGEEILNSLSVPFGSLFLYKKYVSRIIPKKEEIRQIKLFVKKELGAIEWLKGCADDLCLIGGTSRAIARLHQEMYSREQEPLQGYRFDAADIGAILNRIDELGDTGIKMIARQTPERLHTIIPGMLGFIRIIKISGAKTVTLSRNGVREGYLQEYVLGRGGPDQTTFDKGELA